MLQNERKDDRLEALTSLLEGWQRKLWTATPGIIQGPVAADGTVSVVPSIKAKVRTAAGEVSDKTLPMLIHCPVVSCSGGGFAVTVPVAAGDECLVVFASRCIDGWWQSGGVQSQIEVRMHDLSDGFAILGVRSAPKALAGWAASSMQIRSDDGAMFIELAAGHVCNITAPGGLNITAPTVTMSGDLHAAGEVVRGFGGGDSVTLGQHTHHQPPDSHGDTESATNAPTAGT